MDSIVTQHGVGEGGKKATHHKTKVRLGFHPSKTQCTGEYAYNRARQILYHLPFRYLRPLRVGQTVLAGVSEDFQEIHSRIPRRTGAAEIVIIPSLSGQLPDARPCAGCFTSTLLHLTENYTVSNDPHFTNKKTKQEIYLPTMIT